MNDTAPSAGITVYWRPGCGFCAGLFRQLDKYSVAYTKIDIWSEPAGAAFVRSVARGNETVPTVAVGPVAMVNPSVHEVLSAAAEHAPDAVPADYQAPQQGRLGSWISNKLGG
ncbi:MAG: glutaredoxin domain-containing protein [Ilumatobacteraceae bacterium]